MRILGLDYGSKTVGVAVSDELLLTAIGVETIARGRENRQRKTLARVGELVDKYKAGTVVIGLPLNMDTTEGERAEEVRKFGAELSRRTGVKVIYQDERLTTVEAEEILDENRVSRQDRRAVIDTVAACVILQEYLDNLKTLPDPSL